MIIKSISVNKSGVSNVINYIFKEQKLEEQIMEKLRTHFFVKGQYLSRKYQLQLLKLHGDEKLLRELEQYQAKKGNKNIKGFVSHYLAVHQQPFLIKSNIRSKGIEGYIKEFKKNEDARIHARSNQIAIHHTILSWAAKDAKHINDAMLNDMAKEFMKLRGDNNLYLGAKHIERDHIHLHLLVSGTKLNGKASRITKGDFALLKTKLQEYQKEKYPELEHSLPMHGKGKTRNTVLEKELIKNIKTAERATDKDALLELLRTEYDRSFSVAQFLEKMQQHGHVPYYRAGRLQGIKFNGERKFRLNRLGYDEEKLKSLELLKEKTEKELLAIKTIRTGRMKTKDKIIATETAKTKQYSTPEEKELEELQSLRTVHTRELSKENNMEQERDNTDDEENDKNESSVKQENDESETNDSFLGDEGLFENEDDGTT